MKRTNKTNKSNKPKKTKKAEKSKKKAKVNDDDEWVEPSDNSIPWLNAEPGKVTRAHLLAKPFHAVCSYIKENKIGWVKTLADFEIVSGRIKIEDYGYDSELAEKDPQSRYIIPVVVYDVAKDGTLGKNRKPGQVDFEIKLWSLSEPIYRRLYTQFKTWGQDLFHHDLLLTGVEKGSFKFFDDISVAPDCLAEHDDLSDAVEETWDKCPFADNYENLIARTFTEEELREMSGEK